MLQRLGLDGEDVRWAQGLILEAKMVVHRGDFAIGDDLAARVGDVASERGWSQEVIECLYIRARAATRRGEVRLAHRHLNKALGLAGAGGFPELRAVLLRHLTYVCLWSGEIQQARRARVS